MATTARWLTASLATLAPSQLPAEPAPPTLRHCYVTDRNGRLSALLIGWRQLDAGDWKVGSPMPYSKTTADGALSTSGSAGLLDPA